MSGHVSDSGHTWQQLLGQVDIIGNEANAISSTFHYLLNVTNGIDLKEIVFFIGNTNAAEQTAGITIRDHGDQLNYVEITLIATAAFTTLTIREVILGVPSVKGLAFAGGDFRNNVNLFPLVVFDNFESGIIKADASSISLALVAEWNNPPKSLVKNIGIKTGDGTTSSDARYENITARG